jgi:SAM-dependent methyltransferase
MIRGTLPSAKAARSRWSGTAAREQRKNARNREKEFAIMQKLVLNYVDLPRVLKKPLWRFWHNFILSRDRSNVVMTFMNYGYAPVEGAPETIELQQPDEGERFSAQLYDVAVSHTDIADKDVLEVGCGRGGGASHLTRYHNPNSYVGVDLSDNGIRFCNEYLARPNLRFVRGDAEELPFEDHSFDALVNVESSRAYNHIDRFFSEAYRVLKPDGEFLLTDMRWKGDVPSLKAQLAEAGFSITHERNITANVVRALDIDDERRKRLIRRKIPKFLIKTFGEFAGVRGSGRYASFASGAMQYLTFRLVKT